MHLWWEVIKTIYWGGLGIAALFTLLVSRDTIKIRLLTSGIIGLTWPMSLPVVVMFSLF
ncbi:GhoT/OrtT family toxin [Rouxiella chamberiensis]|uniref:GhoT/OrtT family toxin n=1 Tax=Rouxiella chamberiensis TaxID=1513468 RepID=UPI0005D3C32F|nr:GhoT/OrtT family toxin [Rouxiella chamberiensis]